VLRLVGGGRLARGGGEKFDITMFGDEPYGNYNRIMLSNVLAGSDDSSEIYLNALDWYIDNDIDLRAGVRVVRLDPYARLVPTTAPPPRTTR
jgi:nitrite reductase (NADH) large subunit